MRDAHVGLAADDYGSPSPGLAHGAEDLRRSGMADLDFRNAADVPAKYKGESWARLGVDTDHDFEPPEPATKELIVRATHVEAPIGSSKSNTIFESRPRLA